MLLTLGIEDLHIQMTECVVPLNLTRGRITSNGEGVKVHGLGGVVNLAKFVGKTNVGGVHKVRPMGVGVDMTVGAGSGRTANVVIQHSHDLLTERYTIHVRITSQNLLFHLDIDTRSAEETVLEVVPGVFHIDILVGDIARDDDNLLNDIILHLITVILHSDSTMNKHG